MAIPYTQHNANDIIPEVRRLMAEETDEMFLAERAEAQAEFDEEWRRWLAQYDDDGNLKPGLYGTRNYIHNDSREFWAMPQSERREYILSEKKRMGMI